MITWIIILIVLALVVLAVMLGVILNTQRYLIERTDHLEGRLVDLQITISNNKYSDWKLNHG
jgi:hypothetical protein